jgi:glycosyltransferase involved in cell wall biosynthesis
MRVAWHAGQLLQPVPGGIGLYTTALLTRLEGVGVEAVAFAAGPRPRTMPTRVPWIDLGQPRGSLRYEAWHQLRRPRVNLDTDLVHAPSLAVPPVGRTPLAVTVHDIAFLRVPMVTTRRGKSFHTRGLEIARKEAAIVLTPSAFTRLELIREGFTPDDVVVTPLGVTPPMGRTDDDIDECVRRLGLESPYVLTVGTIEPRKDLPTMVAALERLRRTRANLTLAIVGPRGWGTVTGLDRPGVKVFGELPWRIVDALYRRADAVCIASHYEGFGLPALEALVRGKALVAAENSALAEVVGNAAVLFPTGDVDALTNELDRVLDDEALRAELAARGRARAGEMTWELSAAAHADAYRLALSRHLQRL